MNCTMVLNTTEAHGITQELDVTDQYGRDIKISKEQYQVIVLIYSVPLVIIMLCTNGLLALAIYHTKDMGIKKNFFLRSWILVDFLVFLVLLILIGMASGARHLYDYGYKECVAVIGFTTFPIWLGQFHTVLCSYDRYASVLHSSQYETILSGRKIFLYIICAWIISVFCSCIPLMWEATISGTNTCNLLTLHKGYLILISVSYFIIVLGVIGYLYICIYLHVQRHQSQLHVTHTMAQDQLLADSTLAKIMFLNTLLFIALWLPFNLVSLTSLGDTNGRKGWQTALLCSFFIGSIGSTCKLFVFCIFSHDFRILVLNIITLRNRIHPMNSSGMLG